MRVVIASNVLASAMLSPHAPPAQAVRLAIQGELGVLHDDRILAEYREVLLRPKFDFDAEAVHAMLDGIQWIGETVFARPLSVELPDADDLPFLEVATAGVADALVTENARHYRPVRGRHTVRILTPRELLDSLPRE